MKNKRITKISVETERVLVVARPGSAQENFCARCGTQEKVLRIEDAAAVSLAWILRQLEADKLHYIEIDERLFICLNSLIKQIRKEIMR